MVRYNPAHYSLMTPPSLHLAEPLEAGLPVEGEHGVIGEALPHNEGVGEAKPEAANPQDECQDIETALHLLKVIEAVVSTVGLGVEGLITWGRRGE